MFDFMLLVLVCVDVTVLFFIATANLAHCCSLSSVSVHYVSLSESDTVKKNRCIKRHRLSQMSCHALQNPESVCSLIFLHCSKDCSCEQ